MTITLLNPSDQDHLYELGIDALALQTVSADTLAFLQGKTLPSTATCSRNSSVRNPTPFPQSLSRRQSGVESIKESLPSLPSHTRTNSTVSTQSPRTSVTLPRTYVHPHSPAKSVRFKVSPPTMTRSFPPTPPASIQDAEILRHLTKTSSRFSPLMVPANHSKTASTWRYDFVEDRMTFEAIKTMDLFKLDWSVPIDMDKLLVLSRKACDLFLHQTAKGSDEATGYWAVFSFLAQRSLHQRAFEDQLGTRQFLYPASVVRFMMAEHKGTDARAEKLFADYRTFQKSPSGR